jgi:GntR family transcriptional repressor for pyruvate dehydrogenase complex
LNAAREAPVSETKTIASPLRSRTLARAPSLADTLASRLKEEIVAGRLSTGARLPSEHHISEGYGVSRPTVREAIGRLKQDGLVVSRQGSGVYVADPRAASVFRLDTPDFANAQEMRAIVELLIAIEGMATQLTAQRRSKAELKLIKARLDAVQKAIDRGEPGVEEDVAFHRAIIDAADNPHFRDLTDFLDRKVRGFIRTARANSARFAGLAQIVQSEHAAIYEAIAAGDPPAARAAAERHVVNASERLRLYTRDT